MTTPTSSPDAVRSEVRAWLAESWDPTLPLGRWWRRLADSGWGFPHYPNEWGGRGLPAEAEAAVGAELDAAGAYGPPWGIATMMVGPLLLELGTDEQRRRWLPGIMNGTEVWCQLFSEPGAGSDLAGLGTRAVRDGDRWIVNGQKVWTSGGHYAERAILLARTNQEAAKHHGITFFIIEMEQPGVEVRPLVQMTGDAEFNEVFLTDAEVPVADVIGDVDKGWGVALRLLSYERESIDPDSDGGLQHRLDLDEPVGRYATGALDDGTRGFMPTGSEAWVMIRDLLAERNGDDQARAALARQDAARLYSYYEIARYQALRAAADRAAGRLPGPEVSLGKLANVRALQKWADLALRLLGPSGQLLDDDAPAGGRLARIALSIPGMRIAGGTDEIQRNIIGERVLGLPREPRPTER